ncbi:DUF4340 domain-containing protein [uncultured Paludibaculum sp.]|uniref:DUF4340 domain-containing protein n=1 Tax=uncultured Paludibaculum sp. TaxID=1765020 RepID=UPI002AABDA1B|nr:DUF4340 domain-containing protein [uncultured Paludibaculum sp.]
MKAKGLLVAVVLLAALGGAVYWSNKQQKEEAAKPPADAPPKILTLNEGDVTAVDIKRREGETTALKRGGSNNWSITAPQAFDTDRDAINQLLTALTSLSSEKVIEEKPADLAGFGLKTPAVQIVLSLKNGKTRTVSLGDEAPVGGATFTQVDGDARVFTISSTTRATIDKLAVDFRDKRLLKLDVTTLARLQLTLKGTTLEFSKNGRNEWAIVSPKPMRADGFEVDELARKLTDAKLDPLTTSDQKADLAKQFAASTPVATVTITDAAAAQKLEVRKNKENKFYARSSVVEGFHLISDEIGKALEKTPEDFRNKKLFSFGFTDPSRIDYKDAARQLNVSKAGDRWVANNKTMDSVGVQSLIDRLRDLSATKFPDSGFSTSEIEIGVTSQDGKVIEKVSISKAGDHYIARREGEPSLYELEAKSVTDLQKAASDVKEQPPAKGAGK